VAAPSNAIKTQALFDSSPSARQHGKVIKAGFFLSGGVSVAMSREVLYVCVHIHRAESAPTSLLSKIDAISLSLSLSPCRQRGHGAFISAFVDDARVKNAHITPYKSQKWHRQNNLIRCRIGVPRCSLSVSVFSVLATAAAGLLILNN